ncbi:MAG TPA: tRNA epoxyqueuosine(34) reductase QueG [Alloacidobacterium sp.]|nr:tRNA epoxyqueuosine(34) reductase QueG [Alloacidobacterium sp.]
MAEFLSGGLVDKLACDAGFTLAGVTRVPAADTETTREERSRFERWIARGAAGEMEYLKRKNEDGELVRSSLHAVFPWAKSVIVCAANYNSAQPRSTDPAPEGTGWIARYAWSGSRAEGDETLRPSDYHKVLLKRLRALDAALKERMGEFESRCYVDTGPLVERVYARYAGIGWTGKNTCILNQKIGSWFFLGVILTSMELAPEEIAMPAADRCGSCTRCIDACPTQALTPYEMDATRCISYLTIEKRGAIPEELRAGMGRQVFGCDICQDVCPWNKKAPVADDAELMPREALVNPALDWLAGMDESVFSRWFNGSPVARAKFAGLRRNVAIAMGNSGTRRHMTQLEAWSHADDPALREAAAWALERLLQTQRAPSPGQEANTNPQ